MSVGAMSVGAATMAATVAVTVAAFVAAAVRPASAAASAASAAAAATGFAVEVHGVGVHVMVVVMVSHGVRLLVNHS